MDGSASREKDLLGASVSAHVAWGGQSRLPPRLHPQRDYGGRSANDWMKRSGGISNIPSSSFGHYLG